MSSAHIGNRDRGTNVEFELYRVHKCYWELKKEGLRRMCALLHAGATSEPHHRLRKELRRVQTCVKGLKLHLHDI